MTARIPVTRRTLVKGALGGTALIAAPWVRRVDAAEVLYVNTWGGAWEAAAKKNIFEPFTKETGVEIRTVSPVSVAKLAAQARTGVYEFDVTTLGGGDIVRANKAGIIEPINDKAAADMGLWKDAVFQNGVASHAFATVIAYRTDKFPNGGPKNWAEFWDTKKFPGTRCLQKYAARIIPIALLADGVPMDKLYPLDVERAFKSLERIKPSIRVWWTQGPQSQQLLRDGEIDLIGIWNGRILELMDQKAPAAIEWNQAEIDRAYWVIAKGTPRAELARKYIKTAVSATALAGFCKSADYGPLNPEAFKVIPENEAKRMPTYPPHYKLAFEQDVLNAGIDFDAVTKRFDQWLAS
ncbi:MAG: ABC transporter substrate-binding protein [Pseudolabrys sp.]|nr:ABC transporter substrate-binding protein [Pseudolabrys sp.]MCW5684410.1 ABC transporter substrate-binding protein [Pseudolabrys sp.]